ncbi:hypothetical protein TSUD_238700 [Trifolium subterraneum]|uniref:F-box associated beta-propeller type 1 domain-containing protein n=1 Tax=Trifolium subterraneum TaxID=3900 RepID=A0A2Z6PJQ2_TRISU|nr:hypothetical protein TSUD_238700 [Trifolium subterraneum]
MVVASTNEELKVSNNLHIHDDLAFSILSKLPLKSLKRFGCVRSDYGDTFLILYEAELLLPYRHVYHSSIYLLPDEIFENMVKLDLPPPFQEDDTGLHILNSVSINGILCVGQDGIRGRVNSFRAVLWNPATTEFTVIPPSPYEIVPTYRDPSFRFQGFGYDRVRDDYKLIRYINFFHVTDEEEDVPYEDRFYDPLLEIYSLRSNSWKILDINIPGRCYGISSTDTGVYTDGVCHWCGKIFSLDDNDYLVSFDFVNEVLFTTPMQFDVDGSCNDVLFINRHLVVLNESIALISNFPGATTFHISILGELGVKKSWITLFIVGPIPSVECPIGVVKEGNICFKEKDDELVWVDLRTQIIDEVGVNARYCQIGIYKETLLPIGGMNN